MADRFRYTNIQIVGQDDPSMLKKWKLSRAARLIRLRSTLRSNRLLAALVKTLHVSDPNIPLYLPDDNPNPEYDAYLCTLATVVMACPNLEALTGFIPFYNHTFDRLTHALSTRAKLRQHVWIIAENEDVRERSQIQLPPGLLDEYQAYQFMLYHDRWKHLETFMLCSPGGLGVIEHQVFVNVLHSLPSLKNLCISSFDADDFHDTTLLSLPAITSLRIEECSGITDAGLTRWAGSPNAARIEGLSLLHQDITNLLTLSKIFASLDRLTKFTIAQTDVVPSLPVGDGLVVFQPILASKSLRFLHWDILSNDKPPCNPDSHESIHRCISRDLAQLTYQRSLDDGHQTPNMHLGLSISHNGFPSLTHLRAPRDLSPYGFLQSVCRSSINEKAISEGDTWYFRQLQEKPESNSLWMARLRAQSIFDQTTKSQKGTITPTAANHSKAVLNDKVRSTRRSNSEVSTPTLCSRETVMLYPSSKSTDADVTNPTTVDDLVLPITSEQGLMYSSGRDSDKEVAVGPRSTNHHHQPASKREGICRCEPTSTTSRESICICDTTEPPTEPLNHENMRARDSPPPPSHLRPRVNRLDASSLSKASTNSSSQSRNRYVVGHCSSTAKTSETNRPIFYLKPDVPGQDENGGLAGWGELLRINEKARLNHNPTLACNVDSDEDSGTEDQDQKEKEVEGMCTGYWNRPQQSEDRVGELLVTKKILTASSTTSVNSGPKLKLRSKLRSSSRLTLPIGLRGPWKEKQLKKRQWTHVQRPTGERGGCVTVEDFF